MIFWSTILTLTAMHNKRQTAIKAQNVVDAAQAFVAEMKMNNGLRPRPSNLILKKGEVCFFIEPSSLYETRAVRHYQSGGAGFRVAKGVYVGGSKGRSVSSEEWSHISKGCLAITNKRLIFDGDTQNRNIPIEKIMGVNHMLAKIEISSESRQKSMVFSVSNSLIAGTIIRVCSQADDPANFGEEANVDIEFI